MTVVTEHLERRGIHFELLPHERSHTALAEARVLHIDADELAKAVVLDVSTGHALAILPASRRLDLERVRDALGEPDAVLASEAEVEGDFPQFELGALPALPSLFHVPVVIDPGIFTHRTVTFSAGVQRASVRTDNDVLRHGSTVTIAPIAGAARA